MIERPAQLKTLRDGLKASPVVALLGPRQCGKTTLAAALADLRLDRLLVVHPGKARFPLGKKIEALPLADCLQEVAKLGGR